MKSLLITGGNKGIGFEIARQLGNLGFNVFLTARDEKKGKNAVLKLNDMNISAEFVRIDVTDEESIINAFKEISFEISSLDVLINNAGVLMDKNVSIKQVSKNDILQTIDTNTIGPILVTRTFLPLLKEGSRIINISSVLGTISNGMVRYSPIYSMSKTGLNAVTCQYHLLLKGKNIAVNSMCPGWVRTDMGGSGADRPVEKGAETAVWLATEAPIELSGKFFTDKKEIPW